MDGVEGHHGAEHRDDGEVGDGVAGQPALAGLRGKPHLSFPGPRTSDVERSPNNIVQRWSRALRLGEICQS